MHSQGPQSVHSQSGVVVEHADNSKISAKINCSNLKTVQLPAGDVVAVTDRVVKYYAEKAFIFADSS